MKTEVELAVEYNQRFGQLIHQYVGDAPEEATAMYEMYEMIDWFVETIKDLDSRCNILETAVFDLETALFDAPRDSH